MSTPIELLKRVRAMYTGFGLLSHKAVEAGELPEWKGESVGGLIAEIDDAIRAAEITEAAVRFIDARSSPEHEAAIEKAALSILQRIQERDAKGRQS